MKSPRYKYMMLYEKLRRSIENGIYAPGDKLPSIRELQQEEGLSKNTVLQALSELESEGYLRAALRSGFYVEKNAPLYPSSGQGGAHTKRIFTNQLAYDYDLSPNAVAGELFPFSPLRRFFSSALHEDNTHLLYQEDPKGLLRLRQALSKHLSRHRNMTVDPEQIVVTAGLEYAYQILFHLFDPKAVFGLEDPGYPTLSSMLGMNGLAHIFIPVDRSGIEVETLRRSNVSIAVVTPAHQFPSGIVMSPARRKELLDWVGAEKDRYLIEDDYDSEFRWSGRPVPALHALDTGDSVVYMGNFSKSLAPGLRVSFMVLPERLLKRYHAQLPFLICPVSTFLQDVLARMIEERAFERHLNKLRVHYRKTRTLTANALSESDLFSVMDHKNGTYFLLSFPDHADEDAMIARLREKGVLIEGLRRFCHHIKLPPTLLFGYGALNEKNLQPIMDLFLETLRF